MKSIKTFNVNFCRCCYRYCQEFFTIGGHRIYYVMISGAIDILIRHWILCCYLSPFFCYNHNHNYYFIKNSRYDPILSKYWVINKYSDRRHWNTKLVVKKPDILIREKVKYIHLHQCSREQRRYCPSTFCWNWELKRRLNLSNRPSSVILWLAEVASLL